MAKYKLSETSPFHLRVLQLMNTAETLGISIDYSLANARVIITDTSTNKQYYMEDVDSNTPVTQIPAFSEYKLTFSK